MSFRGNGGYSTIQNVAFSITDTTDHEKESYANITNYELFNSNGQPVISGVYDKRLGTTDHSYTCGTCNFGKKLCAGHRGHFKLRASVLQPIAISEIRKWLRIVCLKCGDIVVEKNKFEHFPLQKRLSEASTISAEGKSCPSCGTKHPRIIKDDEDHFTFWAEPVGVKKGKNDKIGIKLYPDVISTIFQKISNATVLLLGRSLEIHPKKLVIKTIVIPPNTIRPGVKSYGGSGSTYHDSTNLLQTFVKQNSQVPLILPTYMTSYVESGVIIDSKLDFTMQIYQQLYYDLIMGSSSTNVSQGNSGKRGLLLGTRPIDSFLRKLSRKEGRIRLNLLGKRVFYISRSTISGNMKYHINEVGIPLEFARILQVEEVVQSYNIEWLTPFFQNGRNEYPGCTHIIKQSTREIHDISGLRNSKLEIGDVIYRDIINGDYAYFNRQPTLERSSIGVHKIIVIIDPAVHTFQFNVLACEWYNADFDGDQMNLWVARSNASRAEASIMSGVSNWFISTKTSGPVNGEVQDSLVGSYELTKTGVMMDKYHAMSIVTSTSTIIPKFDKELYTGRDIISLLLAETPIDYKQTPGSYSDLYAPFIKYDKDDILTIIQNGKLLKGVLDKKSVKTGATGGIFHLISREYGKQKALDAIYTLQQVTLQFLLRRGFTVGTADLLPSGDALEQIKELVSSVILESKVITDKLLRNEIIPPINSTVHEFYEKLQIASLKVNESEILRWILNNINTDTNGLFKMISVGSKGTNPNMIHIMGAIGQTTINGERIREQFSFRRTSPYFPRFSTDPMSYGFVGNSYMTGMTTSEFIFQDMNGRFDLITKALSTASTGYFMRKGVMNNQSCIIDNLRYVTQNTKIVQFIYGEDGMDSRELERINIWSVFLSNDELREKTIPDSSFDYYLDVLIHDRDEFRKSRLKIEDMNFNQLMSADILLPINISRMISNINDEETKDELNVKIKEVLEFCEKMPYCLLNEIQERKKGYIPPYKKLAVELLCVMIRLELNPKRLMTISIKSLSFIFSNMRIRYINALIDYGTAVGIIAAQCISEPLTQYMLDSHHRSVGSGTSKSGLAKVSEIYGGKTIAEEQFSQMQVVLHDVSQIKIVANNIELNIFKQFVKQYDILLENYNELQYPEFIDDKKWMNVFLEHHPLISIPNDLTNWCFRFEIDKTQLILKSIELELIIRKLRELYVNIFVIHTPETSQNIIIRIWNKGSQFKHEVTEDMIQQIIENILQSTIRGLDKVMNTSIDKKSKYSVIENGKLVKEEIPVIITTGTNLYGIMTHPLINKFKTISSSVGDTTKMFGIEAGRAKIISETRAFMADNTPNLRHLYMYADEMTRIGRVTSVERSGHSAREHGNILLRMAYGAPIQVVTDATLMCAKSKIYGIAAPQLLGSVPQIGTLYNSYVIDEEYVSKNVKSVDSFLDEL